MEETKQQPLGLRVCAELAQGGHLTHGSPVNFSGKLYNIMFLLI